MRVPHLASHVLGQWRGGCPVDWLETFVEHERFGGSCYRAANWQCGGQPGAPAERDHTQRVPIKDVYLYRWCPWAGRPGWGAGMDAATIGEAVGLRALSGPGRRGFERRSLARHATDHCFGRGRVSEGSAGSSAVGGSVRYLWGLKAINA